MATVEAGTNPVQEAQIRLAVSGEPSDETLAFGRQIGATEFAGGPVLPTERGSSR